jgi:hypothetical protein
MSYFIFLKNQDNIDGSNYRIAENEIDFNNLNIIDSDYIIIQDSLSNFEEVKYGIKKANSYNGNTINYMDINITFKDKDILKKYVDFYKQLINNFLNNNLNDPQFQRWSDYKNQLSNLDLASITYPLNMSLEQYFKEQNQPSLSPLQIP